MKRQPKEIDFTQMETPAQNLGVGLMLVGTILPAMSLLGAFPDRLSLPAVVGLSLLVGTFTGTLLARGRARPLVGAVCGIVAQAGAMAAIVSWWSWRREPSGIEVAIAFFVGVAPGGWLFRRWVNAERRRQPRK